MQKLWGCAPNISGSSNVTGQQSKKDKQEQKLCDALSWIALAFVREAAGRDVAVCLNPTKPIVELLISDNLGSKQRLGDNEVVQSIISITTLALNTIKAKGSYTPHGEDVVYKEMIEMMVGLDWDRIG